MSWTAPRTWVTGEVPTAGTFNTHLRDDLIALQPQAAAITTLQSTATTTYTDLGTVGPAVTLATGATALVDIGCGMFNGTVNDGAQMSYAVTGASAIAASDANGPGHTSATSNALVQAAFSYLQTGLTPGTNTFTAKYKAATGGSASFAQRIIIVTACF